MFWTLDWNVTCFDSSSHILWVVGFLFQNTFHMLSEIVQLKQERKKVQNAQNFGIANVHSIPTN